ncbi:DNA-binding protein [Cryobacterium sp. TMT2-23]|uniref:DNA-binding protein n=1 Tax=Cryobacterium sp. TMT2-23 TaxID=1259252 RepID=UPI00106A78BA|nr:DNA-binding protein [Cryobacterium sp. TMT2-23]TFD23178.1 DNA-binding protein [Cryobacterium sp. TMT2-23]
MFVITADQIDSRNDRDRAGEMIDALIARFPGAFILPPDQTAGDEIQMLLTDARSTLDVILDLQRSGHWSIGLGIGEVRRPLPASARQASGHAFVGARAAVTRAKKAEGRFGLELAGPTGAPPLLGAEEVEALVTTLLLLRQRRTTEGWAAVDLLGRGLTQVEIAVALEISAAAVSQRLRSALWRVDQSAQPALVRLLENLQHATTETGPAA